VKKMPAVLELKDIEKELNLVEMEPVIKCLRVSEQLKQEKLLPQVPVYETRKWLYILVLPLMWILVAWVFLKKMVIGILGQKLQTNTLWVDGLSPISRRVKEGAASWKALDLIYNYYEYRNNLKGVEKLIADFWFGMRNGQAVRNRKLLVAEQLSSLIRKTHQENGKSEVKIFSIASGSAQAVFEAIEKSQAPVKVCLLDLDQNALDYSLTLARKMEIRNLISLSMIQGTATNHEVEIQAFQPHVIEMVGFMDYRPKEKAIRLVQKIYRSLPAGGYFLTANMCPNHERFFMKWVLNWSMVYRKPHELRKILEAGGFQNPTIHLEPQGLHAVAVCKK
jgi:SAM-dependent methyltransferase